MGQPEDYDEKETANSVRHESLAAPVEEDCIAPEAIGTDNLPDGYFTSWKFIGTILGVSLMNISLYVSYVMPVNFLSIINADIGPDPKYVLIPITKTLGRGVGVLLVGRLGDIFGRRWFLIGGQTLGVIGAAIGATAQSINVLIGSTAFIGIAGAVQLTFFVVVQVLVPNKHRGLWVGIQFILSFPFACFGPIMARSLVLHTAIGWRWCYYLDYGLLRKGQPLSRELRRLDYIGLTLYCGGLIVLLLGITWGGSVHLWTSGKVIGNLVGGFVSIVLFGIYETFLPFKNVHPLIPVKVFRSKDFLALCGTGSVATMTYYSMNLLWPTMVTALFTTDIILVGWYSCVLGGGVALGQIFASVTMRLFGRPLKVHWQIRLAAIGMAAFVASMASVTASRLNLALVLMSLASFSVGYVELISLVLVPFTAPPGDIGLASGFQSTVRGNMGTIATAIYSTVLANRNAVNIPKEVASAVIRAGLAAKDVPSAVAAAELGTPSAFAKIPDLIPTIRAAIVEATKVAKAQSFRYMFLITISFSVPAVLGSFFVGNMDGHLNNEVARKLQGIGDRKKDRRKCRFCSISTLSRL
ncbi:uncharacterized protein PV09_06465 [Verruconis gallopava]|uniref:Major facilitator superfamily (MFS) profile domain-containing protein n=1 Tax=Verruconis gallopava TaxID=253628 RepID=A0A0D2AT42_9PEZI|nr:uncharacterized protein PV09_06465 [Verruconis gallopava]KIW02319.1 hypothetical protein PV09_06465 [Verruconis gallopava]